MDHAKAKDVFCMQSLGPEASGSHHESAVEEQRGTSPTHMLAAHADGQGGAKLDLEGLDPLIEQELVFRQEIVDRLQETNEVIMLLIPMRSGC